MSIYHCSLRMIGRGKGGKPVKALGYITGTTLADKATGEVFGFRDKSVQEVQILLPENAPLWAREIQKLVQEDREAGIQLISDIANGAEKRVDAQMFREVEVALFRELTHEQNKACVEEFIQDQFCQEGMLAIQAFHCEMNEDTGEMNPHCHTFLLTRELVEDGLASHKNRLWNSRALPEQWREQWAQVGTKHLRAQRIDITLDHRSYKDQGIDMEPQPKLGKGIKAQERRLLLKELKVKEEQKKALEAKKQKEKMREEEERKKEWMRRGKGRWKGREKSRGKNRGVERATGSWRTSFREEEKASAAFSSSSSFIVNGAKTNRMQEFRNVQLRNLYRVVRRPEVILDIVTRNHTTFMWGDVQKTLHRYVDDPVLFGRLEVRLKTSSELLVLRPEGIQDDRGQVLGGIYTTHSMLASEKTLVKTAESLSTSHSHTVSEDTVHKAILITNAKMKEENRLKEEKDLKNGIKKRTSLKNFLSLKGKKGDSRLSADQERAIRHLVSDGQLKCIVGYAGAGKSTALSTCREIWEAEGYRVYGLAPTGKAAHGLRDTGIPSTTLHTFLKAFESGRSHYNEKSVLVLDEGGMVDVERFQKFLSAVETLGVKAVVVGDGGQLQPVEAGPAFRLVTERVGSVKLEEILRQTKAWQKKATVLFGQGKTEDAIEQYQSRGRVHIVPEKLPEGNSPHEVVKRYEMTARTSGLIFREILKDVEEAKANSSSTMSSSITAITPISIPTFERIKTHPDYPTFKAMRDIQKQVGKTILDRPGAYRPYLQDRRLDPTEMARLFVDRRQPKNLQYQEAHQLLKDKELDRLIGMERLPGQGVEVRSQARDKMLTDWKKAMKSHSRQTVAMMSYSHRDVRELNAKAHIYLQEMGHIGRREFTHIITKEIEDDFGRTLKQQETKAFCRGERIIFTRNDKGLGIHNGACGTITDLDANTITVKLDTGDTLSFAPKLFPYFDQGWAITIHKSQGATVDKSFVLLAHEMNQNLTYVALTRHRDDVQIYGSEFDFWRPEKVKDILSKSGEKLGAADYLDATSLHALMKDEDKFLDKLLGRLSDELHAMGVVSHKAFEKLSEEFLGQRSHSERMIVLPAHHQTLREEQRAEELGKEKRIGIGGAQNVERSDGSETDQEMRRTGDVSRGKRHDLEKTDTFSRKENHSLDKAQNMERADEVSKRERFGSDRIYDSGRAQQDGGRADTTIRGKDSDSRGSYDSRRGRSMERTQGSDNPHHTHKDEIHTQSSSQSGHTSAAQDPSDHLYDRFKEIRAYLKKHPRGGDLYRQELYHLSKRLHEDKEFFAALKQDDKSTYWHIQRIIDIHERVRSVDRGR